MWYLYVYCISMLTYRNILWIFCFQGCTSSSNKEKKTLRTSKLSNCQLASFPHFKCWCDWALMLRSICTQFHSHSCHFIKEQPQMTRILNRAKMALLTKPTLRWDHQLVNMYLNAICRFQSFHITHLSNAHLSFTTVSEILHLIGQ